MLRNATGTATSMSLALDHAFIMCSSGAPEGDSLVERGFLEGSRNVHPGQGTANRRFFFENFMLELIWVEDPAEANSERTRRTRLWERWAGRDKGLSPFGIIFSAAGADASPAPFPTWAYRPAYLPPDMTIDIAEGTRLDEPELYYIPSMRRDRPRDEPTEHALPIRRILGVEVGLSGIDGVSTPLRAARTAGLLSFVESQDPMLEIRYASESGEIVDLKPTLPLVFRGVP